MPSNDLTIHREEYLYLPHLTHDTAHIAWGAFFFVVKGELDGGKWKLIDESDLGDVPTSRKNSIGASSEPYADANSVSEVTLTERATGLTQSKLIGGANHAVFRGLKPNAVYTYSVKVNNKVWGAGPLRDWKLNDDEGFMGLSSNVYENEFRTFPDPNETSPDLTFAILGDFGRGIKKPSKKGVCQREVAESLNLAVKQHDVRLILTTGDNIYHGSGQGSGDEDDDWFYTFFQPYRFVINRIPVFPAAGNHDDGETLGESTDDRGQLYDNLYIQNRFASAPESGDASLFPGLFYRVRFGAHIEFSCLDTSKQRIFFADRYFKHDNHQPFIETAFPDENGASTKWRIPFFHHPPFCAGPDHGNKESVSDFFGSKFSRAGVRAVFSGHQHNFQHSLDNNIHYFVTGGSGKFASSEPDTGKFAEARTQAWGGNDEGHFLLVNITGDEMEVVPVGHLAGGTLRPIKINVVAGSPDVPPFKVTR